MIKQKIDSLTSLRFFAAAAILVFHARGNFGLPTNFLSPFELTQGVSFFFVLSGFILAFVYPKLDEAGAKGKFLLARFARIWPMHLASLVLYLLLVNEYEHAGLAPLAANLTLLQSWWPDYTWYFSYNAVAWSISTEAFFYISFPFLIKDFDRTWGAKLAFSFALIVAMCELGNWLHLSVWPSHQLSIYWLMYINPLSRLFEFVLGMTAAHLYGKYLIKRDTKLAVALGCELVALTFVYFMMLNTVKIAECLARLPYVQEGGRVWLEHCGVPLLSFALLIVVMAWGRGPIARVLRLKPLVFLGEISFAIYLLHRVLLQFYWEHFAPEQGPGPFAIYLAVLLALSFLFWSLIEVPCRQFIVRPQGGLPRPTLVSSLAAGLALVFVTATWFGIWSGAPLERLDLAAVRAELQAERAPDGAHIVARKKLGDIAFGDELLLLGTKTRRDAQGLTMTVYWQALRQQRLNFFIGLKLLSESNALVGVKYVRQSLREEEVEAGECFKNELFVPASELTYVNSFVFRPRYPTGVSPPARIIQVQSGAEAPKICDGFVAVKIAPSIVSGKDTGPAL
jgi:peptidoglycan/LPS O-acetylase OafA/YrhL